MFDGTRTVTLVGKVTDLDWANPHCWLFIAARPADQPDAAPSSWDVQAESPAAMISMGWRKDSIMVGDEVTVAGYPRKDGRPQIWFVHLDDAQGHHFPSAAQRAISSAQSSPAYSGSSSRPLSAVRHSLHVVLWKLFQSKIATAVKEWTWLFPTLETIHIFGIVFLVGATTIIDLRLLGIAFQSESVTTLHARFFPWIWAGFAVQVITGILLFSSEVPRLVHNDAFIAKMLLLVVAGINALVYEKGTSRDIEEWKNHPVAPLGPRINAVVSLVVWMGVITAGRWIAYL